MIARTFRELALIGSLALIPALVSGFTQLKWRKEEPLLANEVRLATAQTWGDKVLWVDVRDEAAFESGHIPGSLRLTAAEWDAMVAPFLDQWDPEKSTIVYGKGGSDDDAHEMAERLAKELQLDGVFVLKGGWEAWQQK
ncbi:MAG TPA: rhodanese-like domain-containing protein [Chthoniobacteraceae bacterium]